MDQRFVDQEARDLARDAKSSLDTHRAVVTGQLDTIKSDLAGLKESVAETKSFLKWFGGLLVTTILSVLAWSLVQQYSTNDKATHDLQEKLALIQEQERAQLPAGTAKPAVAAPSP